MKLKIEKDKSLITFNRLCNIMGIEDKKIESENSSVSGISTSSSTPNTK
jgi:hypothetical protein